MHSQSSDQTTNKMQIVTLIPHAWIYRGLFVDIIVIVRFIVIVITIVMSTSCPNRLPPRSRTL